MTNIEQQARGRHIEVLRQMLHPLLGSKWLCDETKREALEFAIRALSAPDNAEGDDLDSFIAKQPQHIQEAIDRRYRELSADNAEAVSDHDLPFDTIRKVVRALTRLGVSTPYSQEEQAARAVELVNLLCREITNPTPAARVNYFNAQQVAAEYGLDYNKFCAAHNAMIAAQAARVSGQDIDWCEDIARDVLDSTDAAAIRRLIQAARGG